MTAPDGTMPAFGDYRPYSQVRLLRRGAAIFDRPEWCGEQTAGGGDLAASGFTVLRAGPPAERHYLAVDHGPLGGQHSHADNMGFIAYAFGEPIALDAGLPSAGYADPLYGNWSRNIRAHNVVAIDGLEPEKVSSRRFLHRGEHASVVAMRSEGYRHALGVTHDRTIFFCRDGLWLVCDFLSGVTAEQRCEWILHTPVDVAAVRTGVLRGRSPSGRVGLTVLAARPDELEPVSVERRQSALPVPDAAELRLQDAVVIFHDRYDGTIPMVSWIRKPSAGPARFAVAMLATRGERVEASVEAIPVRRGGRACKPAQAEAFEVRAGDQRWVFALAHDGGPGLEAGGVRFPGVCGVARFGGSKRTWQEDCDTQFPPPSLPG